MALLSIATRNLARRKKRTALLFAIVAFSMALLVLAESVFASAGRGLERSFRGCLTGDFALAAPGDDDPSAEDPGLFGDESPVVGEYSTIPPLDRAAELRALVAALPGVEAVAPQVTARALLQVEQGISQKVFAFGIEPDAYRAACPEISLPPVPGGPFIMVNAALLASIEAGLGRALVPGESINLAVAAGGGFRVRSLPFRGPYEYLAPTEALGRVVLVDPVTAMELAAMDLDYDRLMAASTSEVPSSPEGGGVSDPDPFAGLFEESEGIVEGAAAEWGLEDVERALADAGTDDPGPAGQQEWNFLLVRAAKGADPDRVRALVDAELVRAGFRARTLSWAEAAGFAAMGIQVVAAVVYVGMLIIVVGVLAVLMNSILIAVLERRAEIGGIRALGATKRFVAASFALEVAILVGLAATVGGIVGAGAALALDGAGLRVPNPTIAAFFGGGPVGAAPSPWMVVKDIGFALALGLVAVAYPLRVALRIQPLAAMGGKGS